MSKWIPTRESIQLNMDSSQVGLRKIHFFKKWIKLNPSQLTHGLIVFEPV